MKKNKNFKHQLNRCKEGKTFYIVDIVRMTCEMPIIKLGSEWKSVGISADGDWKYEAAEEEEVLIGANVEKTISIIPTMYPTEQRIKKDEEAKVNNEESIKITKEKLKDIANRVYK